MRGRYIWCLGAMLPVFISVAMTYHWSNALAAPLMPKMPTTPPNHTQQEPVNAPPIPRDADGVPTALRQAAETLFTQGLADPRGGEYRTITVRVGDVWRGEGRVVETHGWVLPDRGEGKRVAVCWNGLTYPVVEVKQPADLAADIQKRLDAQAEVVRKQGNAVRVVGVGRQLGRAIAEPVSISLEYDSLLRIALLLRLQETKLAQALCTAWKVDAPSDPKRPDPHQLDPYLTLAEQWVWSLYDRAVCAHMRGDDALAASDAALLTRVQPLVDAEAKKRGYTTFPNGGVHVDARGQIPTQVETFLPFLSNVPQLRQDSERRLAEKARPPLDIAALKKRPQAERITELLSRLDEIDARQSGQPGGVGLDAHPVSNALIEEGDAAIEPLLEVLEKDTRLTRSVSFGRDFFMSRNLLTVKSAAFTCFARITEMGNFGDGKLSVAVLREWWAKNKDATNVERWLTQLADEGSRPPDAPANAAYEERNQRESEIRQWENARCHRWEEAAARIVERSDIRQQGMWVNVPNREPGRLLPSFKGEALRGKRNPSVSDLLRTRALELSKPTEGRWGFDYARAARFALMLYEWDPTGPQTLPTLRAVMKNCLTFYEGLSRKENGTDQYQLAGRIARLVTARRRLGDTAAVAEYRGWLDTVTPNYLGAEARSALYPLMRDYKDPAMQRLADDLFTIRDGKRTGWNQFILPSQERGSIRVSELLASDLLQYPAFRALVLQRLKETTEAGSVSKNGIRWKDGVGDSLQSGHTFPETPQPLRTCDRAALALQGLKGVPFFDPLDPVPSRDRQCAAIATYLTRYQDILGRIPAGESPLHSHSGDWSIFDYLGPLFPALNRPATAADVRENRAVFTLNDKTARIVPGLRFPLVAQWNNDPNALPGVDANGKPVRLSHGYIWQAEEVRENGKWVRYFGYIGPHSLAKVPATEITLMGR